MDDSQRVRILVSKGYRPYTMLETLNTLHREPQWADMDVELRSANLAIRHAQFSFAIWEHADSLGGNRPL